MPITARCRARLPLAETMTLQPPSPYQEMTAEIARAGREERRRLAHERRLRELGIEGDPDKLA